MITVNGIVIVIHVVRRVFCFKSFPCECENENELGNYLLNYIHFQVCKTSLTRWQWQSLVTNGSVYACMLRI